jgi:hypothetical protein
VRAQADGFLRRIRASVAAGSEVPRQLLEPMPRQPELAEEVIERERRLQRELAGQLVAPVEGGLRSARAGGATLRRQAEALQAAGRGDEETAGLMKSQAELVERTIGTLRQPAAIAKVENDTRQGAASAAATDPAADHGHRRRGTPGPRPRPRGTPGPRPRLLDLQRTPRSSAPSAPACEHELAPPAVDTSARLVATPFVAEGTADDDEP